MQNQWKKKIKQVLSFARPKKLWNVRMKEAPVTSCNLLKVFEKNRKMSCYLNVHHNDPSLHLNSSLPLNVSYIIYSPLTSEKENLYWFLSSRQALALQHGMLVFILLCTHSRCCHHVEQQMKHAQFLLLPWCVLIMSETFFCRKPAFLSGSL